MDNRTLSAVLICLTIWYGWLAFFAPPADPDSPVSEDAVAALDAGDTLATDGQAPSTAAAPSEDAPELPAVVDRTEQFVACGTSFDLHTADGGLSAIELTDVTARYAMQPLYSWLYSGAQAPWNPYGDEPGPERIVTDRGSFLSVGVGAVGSAPIGVSESRAVRGGFETTGFSSDRVQVERSVVASGSDPCVFDVSVTWRNVGTSTVDGPLWIGVHDELGEMASRWETATRPRALVDGGVEGRDDLDDYAEVEKIDGDVAWFGLADSYFAAFLVPDDASEGSWAFSTREVDDHTLHGGTYATRASLVAGGSHTETFRLYVGRKQLEVLRSVDDDLGDAVELGFLSFFARPLLLALKFFYGLVGNWGIAIISLTVALKLLFFPLTQKSFRSQEAMKVVQPKIEALREQYKDNPDELNRQMFALFRESGVNPFSGCLPMIIQMPVWFALYTVLLGSVELYHTDFLYLRDLSAVDPYMALPTIVVALMLVQQRFMPTGNMDPTQARVMKMMPLIFGVFFYSFPSGLVLYIFVNMLLSILQQWYIKRTFASANAAA